MPGLLEIGNEKPRAQAVSRDLPGQGHCGLEVRAMPALGAIPDEEDHLGSPERSPEDWKSGAFLGMFIESGVFLGMFIESVVFLGVLIESVVFAGGLRRPAW